MSLETRIVALAQAVGADIKTLTDSQGSLSALTTDAKTSLVAALNELDAAIDSLVASGAGINDSETSTTSTWSSSKTSTAIANAISALVSSAPETLDTLNELAAALGDDPNFATTIATEVANRVRYDATQTLTVPQQTQARDNIAAASASTLTTLTTNLGNIDRDFAGDYATAKA